MCTHTHTLSLCSLDLAVWSTASEDIQRSLFNHFYDLLTHSKYVCVCVCVGVCVGVWVGGVMKVGCVGGWTRLVTRDVPTCYILYCVCVMITSRRDPGAAAEADTIRSSKTN